MLNRLCQQKRIWHYCSRGKRIGCCPTRTELSAEALKGTGTGIRISAVAHRQDRASQVSRGRCRSGHLFRAARCCFFPEESSRLMIPALNEKSTNYIFPAFRRNYVTSYRMIVPGGWFNVLENMIHFRYGDDAINQI